jgi:hypothetical protein
VRVHGRGAVRGREGVVVTVRLWRTRAGVYVEERGRGVSYGHVKIMAYRVGTGGFHGFLRLDRLVPAAVYQ